MKISCCFLFTILCFSVYGQPGGVSPGYPQDYFRNPLDIPIFLAGNFGECRPGHFHSGLDIKTLGKEGQPVRAAADGYVARIKMDKGGFGHALYITHPNGYTTLYAHLNDFAPAIQKYLKQQQYKQKRWDLDLPLSPTQFPVKKGELIAWSGNTGGSSAPHLHFEIRNTKTEHPLNPQLFGLPLVDKIPPVPKEVVFYTGNIYESKSLFSIPLVKKGGEYKPVKTENGLYYNVNGDTVTIPAGQTGVGINVDDYMDGSDNTITFYIARLYFDDSLQAEVKLDDIGYDETRYINAYVDYGAKKRLNKWIQCMFQIPGNRLGRIFSYLNDSKGKIGMMGGNTHKLTIILIDDSGNETTISFFVRPLSERSNITREEPGCVHFFAGKVNELRDANVALSLDERQLYDDVCFQFKAPGNNMAYPEKYQLHNPFVPVHHYFDLKIKPNKVIAASYKDKVVMIYSDGKDEDGRAAAIADGDWYTAKVRTFGTYWLDIDTIPPVIESMQRKNSSLAKARQIAFTVTDNMTSVKTFSGYLDGKWICFEQHGSDFFYKFDEHCSKGKHKLVFKAADENGNEADITLNFVR